MPTYKKILFALFFIILISSCKDVPTKPDENSEKFKTYIEQIDKIADSLTTNRKFNNFPDLDMNLPGVVIGVWSKNTGFSYAVAKGKADLASGRILKADDLFRIASITKTFTITVLLQLVMEEKLSLEDKLSKFYPDWPRADEVTIRMMCNMSSGIFDLTGNPDFFAQLELNPLKNWTPDELVNFAKDKPYYFNPGTGFQYSNTNTTLIGMIIEKITGNTLHNEIKTRIIEKLSLNNTFIPNDQYFPSGFSYSKGYHFESDSNYKVDVTEKYSPTCSWSAGELISNFNDLKVWAEALGEGKIVSTSIQTERLQTVSPCWTGVPFLEKVTYGLGIMNYLGYIGHGGDNFGYHSYMCYDPIKKIGTVVLYNYIGSAISTAQEVLKIVDPTL